MEALIGPETINTITLETLESFRDHGRAGNRLEDDMIQATKVLADLEDKGIDIDLITQKLEDEGIEKFNKAYDEIMEAIENKRITQMV